MNSYQLKEKILDTNFYAKNNNDYVDILFLM